LRHLKEYTSNITLIWNFTATSGGENSLMKNKYNHER